MAKRAKRSYGWLWAAALFFSVGYLITVLGIPALPPAPAPATTTPTAPALPMGIGTSPARMAPGEYEPLRSPLYAMVALVAMTIPFAARTRGLLAGGLRGLGLGAAGAGGIALALNKMTGRVQPEAINVATAMAFLISMICCGAAGAIFALLAERRHRRIYGE